MSDLRQAAQAVLNRWDSPNWEWKHYGSPRFLPTATLMSALRKALAEQQPEPVTDEAIHAAWSAGFVEGEKAALAEPVQEPVAWMAHQDKMLPTFHRTFTAARDWADNPTPLYTAPPRRKPLTIAEVEQILAQHNYEIHGDRARYIVRMTEEAHGIKEGT